MDGKRSSIGSVSHSSFDCPFYKPRSKKDTRELTSAVLLWKLELAIVMVPSLLLIAPPCTHATSRCAHASHQPVIGLGIMENVEYKVSLRASVSAIYRHLPWTITSSHHPTSHFLHLSLHQTSRRSFSLHNTTQHNTAQRNTSTTTTTSSYTRSRSFTTLSPPTPRA